MYYPLAQQEFESYLNGYDRENDRIKLKIIHTYGVVKQAEELAGRMASFNRRHRPCKADCTPSRHRAF